MRLLLDTNALVWWLLDNPRIGPAAHETISDPRNDVYVSAVSAWELAIKIGIGRLVVPRDVASWLPPTLEENDFLPLPITMHQAASVERLPTHHTDLFDRLLIAQAIAEGMTIVSADRIFARYEVQLIPC